MIRRNKKTKKFIRWSGLLLLLVLLSSFIFMLVNKERTVTSTKTIAVLENITVEDLWVLTNQNRSKPLLLDERLNRSAQAKCEDMVARNYWSHNAPDGTEPWIFVKKEGIPYKKAGENQAEGLSTTKLVVDGWMNSTGHRKNLQDPEFHKVGFGICKSNSYAGNNGLPATIVVQHFTD